MRNGIIVIGWTRDRNEPQCLYCGTDFGASNLAAKAATESEKFSEIRRGVNVFKDWGFVNPSAAPTTVITKPLPSTRDGFKPVVIAHNEVITALERKLVETRKALDIRLNAPPAKPTAAQIARVKVIHIGEDGKTKVAHPETKQPVAVNEQAETPAVTEETEDEKLRRQRFAASEK